MDRRLIGSERYFLRHGDREDCENRVLQAPVQQIIDHVEHNDLAGDVSRTSIRFRIILDTVVANLTRWIENSLPRLQVEL